MAGRDQLQEFMNPKSAMTIGASGAMVIAFTTTLALSFSWPRPVTALALSALLALLQVSAAKAIGNLFQRAVYFVVVTLVIFHAARGGNTTLADGESAARSAEAPQVSFSLVSSAYADGTNEVCTNAPPVETNSPPTAQRIFERW